MPLYKKREAGTKTEKVQGYIPAELLERFREKCTKEKISFSEGLERSIELFLSERGGA